MPTHVVYVHACDITQTKTTQHMKHRTSCYINIYPGRPRLFQKPSSEKKPSIAYRRDGAGVRKQCPLTTANSRQCVLCHRLVCHQSVQCRFYDTVWCYAWSRKFRMLSNQDTAWKGLMAVCCHKRSLSITRSSKIATVKTNNAMWRNVVYSQERGSRFVEGAKSKGILYAKAGTRNLIGKDVCGTCISYCIHEPDFCYVVKTFVCRHT